MRNPGPLRRPYFLVFAAPALGGVYMRNPVPFRRPYFLVFAGPALKSVSVYMKRVSTGK